MSSAAVLATLPSPTVGVWHLGPLPLRGYALCIITGIVLAAWLTEKRWVARGGAPGEILDIAVWAVPFGIVGGRIYHVITTPEPYWGRGGDPLRAFAIWDGGLGIWGAIVLGGVGAWIACRRKGIPLPPVADAMAPGLLIAQAVGRLGNWFNNELYGKPTDLPWGLTIHQWTDQGRAALDAAGHPIVLGTFQPTFLYELLWDLAAAAVVIWADRRFRLGHGRAFALYVLTYCLGRGWIETLRIDTAEHFFGLRLNVFTAVIVGLGALVYLVAMRGRPREVITRGVDAAAVAAPGAGGPAGTGSSGPGSADQPVAVPAGEDGTGSTAAGSGSGTAGDQPRT